MEPPAARRPFLTARWSNVCILSYPVAPALLAPRLPAGLALDTREGRAFVSLLAFEFRDTRVRGIAWPGFRDFVEWNLRYYVRYGDARGVVFVREFVPSRLVAALARAVYRQPYVRAPVRGDVRRDGAAVAAEYRVAYGGRVHRVAVSGAVPAEEAAETSDAHFFKEHRWGFGVGRDGRTVRFEVRRERWLIHPVRSLSVDVDWGVLYGGEWSALTGATPCSAVLAAGSPVAVFPGAPLPGGPDPVVR